MKLLNQMLSLIEPFEGPRAVSGAELHERDVYAMNSALNASLTEAAAILLRVLYPVCPHITYILWRELGYAEKLGDLLDAPWPAVDEAALVQDELELVLQVNGKLRGSLTVPASADKAAIEALAQTSPAVARFTEGRPIKKVIVVPGRLVNVVA
jgi:leucyl-tRNA synthetase